MADLKDLTIVAHGGIERWRRFSEMTADLVQGGALWALKGQAGSLDRTTVRVGTQAEWASHGPFGSHGRRSRFAPDRVALEDDDGTVLSELAAPRTTFAGHTLETPWTDLQLAYFAGCAMWTYLNLPFLLARPDVEAVEIAPGSVAGEPCRRLQVHFPAAIATHSAVQTLYVGGDGLFRRHDYDVEIAGGTPAAHLIDGYVDVSGIKVPTRRRIFPRQADGNASPDPLVVAIDLSNIRLGE